MWTLIRSASPPAESGPTILAQVGDWQQVKQYYPKREKHVVYYFNVSTQESRWDKAGTTFE